MVMLIEHIACQRRAEMPPLDGLRKLPDQGLPVRRFPACKSISRYAISTCTLGNAGRADPDRATSAGRPRGAFRPDAGKLCALSTSPLSRYAAAAMRATSGMGHRDLVQADERATARGQR